MNKSILVALSACALLQSCHTYIAADGSKMKQLAPMKDYNASALDTTRFVRQPFNMADFDNKAFLNDKRVVETMEGGELQQLAKTGGRHIVFFVYRCPGNRAKIKKLDSLGENPMVVWLTTNHDYIDATIGKTRFSKSPYYTIDAEKNNKIILDRQIRFIKEACPQCYVQYKDELMFTEYLLVENGTIKAVMDNDSTNILRKNQ